VGTITCTIDSLAAGATQSFPVTVTPAAAMAGTTLGLAAAVQSQTPDPVSSNDGATASLEVLLPAQADLSLSIDGPATLPRTAFRAEYVFTLTNNGGVDAAQPTLLIEGNTMTATASVTPPAGWHCSKQTNGGPRPARLASRPPAPAARPRGGFAGTGDAPAAAAG